MARTAGVPRRGKHDLRCYREHALKHHAQALVIVAAVALAFFTLIFTLSIVIPLVAIVGAELTVVTVLPRCQWFRESVDEELECAAIADAIEARGNLLARISDEHRRELEELERLVGRIADRSRQGARLLGTPEESQEEDWLGLGRLLGTYVQLAIAHRTNVEALRATSDAGNPVRDVASLQELRANASSTMLPWIERRLVIARGRVVAAERAREERAMLLHGLATIAELIRWTHDECAASHDELLRSVLVDAASSCGGRDGTLREIVTLCADMESVDPNVFAVRAQTG